MAIHPRHLRNLAPFLKHLGPGEDSDENDDDGGPPALEDTDDSDSSNLKGSRKSKSEDAFLKRVRKRKGQGKTKRCVK